MFQPTHLLVSRTRQTPVQLIPSEQGFKIITEPEWQRGSEPAFEIRSKQGFFCQGISVVGYSLQPIQTVAQPMTAQPAARPVTGQPETAVNQEPAVSAN
jgi:hypothetical protein